MRFLSPHSLACQLGEAAIWAYVASKLLVVSEVICYLRRPRKRPEIVPRRVKMSAMRLMERVAGS